MQQLRTLSRIEKKVMSGGFSPERYLALCTQYANKVSETTLRELAAAHPSNFVDEVDMAEQEYTSFLCSLHEHLSPQVRTFIPVIVSDILDFRENESPDEQLEKNAADEPPSERPEKTPADVDIYIIEIFDDPDKIYSEKIGPFFSLSEVKDFIQELPLATIFRPSIHKVTYSETYKAQQIDTES